MVVFPVEDIHYAGCALWWEADPAFGPAGGPSAGWLALRLWRGHFWVGLAGAWQPNDQWWGQALTALCVVMRM